MNSDDLFGAKPDVVELKANDRWEAIDELIGHLVAASKIEVKHRSAVTEAIKSRERACSTGIADGIALPHAECEFVHDVVAVIGRSRNGIQFDSLDGKLAYTVCLFLVPAGKFQEHVNTLANIAKLLPRIVRERQSQ
jgi:mannitol/fructose-specific phosphotransferase system IIA component (Ntr-type)